VQLKHIQLWLRTVSRVGEVRRDRGSCLEEVLVEQLREREQVPFLCECRFEASRTALGVIVLGSHGALLFRGLKLSVAVGKKAGELGVRNVPQLGHVRRGANLKESAHLGDRGLKWLWFWSRFFLGIGHRGRVRLRRRYWTWFGFRLRNVRYVWFRLRNGVALLFERCVRRFLGLGATDCDDALVFFNVFEGVCCFHFDVGSGFGSLFFNGFVGLNGSGFGAFGVLFLNGLVEAARFFFFWRTRLDELSGTLIDRKESSKASLEKLGSFRVFEAVTWGQ
jgi:hypothetical protein